MPTYIVERYWPGVSPEEAETVIARETAVAVAMRAEGKPIRVVRSTLVQEDETLLSLVEAESEQEVAELGSRAGTPADRIVPALEMLPVDVSSHGGGS